MRGRDDIPASKCSTDGGNEADDRRTYAITCKYDEQRKLSKRRRENIVQIEFLLIVLLQEIVGRLVTDQALPPGDFLQRDEDTEQAQPGREPRDAARGTTVAERVDGVPVSGNNEGPERCPLEKTVFLADAVVKISVDGGERCADGQDEKHENVRQYGGGHRMTLSQRPGHPLSVGGHHGKKKPAGWRAFL